jgi:hypothetical protein
MADTTLTERARKGALPEGETRRGLLGHPLAYASTTVVLFALFGWTFIANPDRVAPTKDPAYYTWRTEALISEDPVTLLEIKGPFDMFAGGYRVAAPVVGGYLRQVAGISSLNVTSLLMVAVPVLTALLLAGFAFRQRRDPLLWHAVALGAASLYLTPPFVGYLDNILCLMFLAAAIWFLDGVRASWAARAGLFLFLVLAGYTHPTTLAIFCLTLGAIAFVRLLFRRFDLRAIVRDEGPVLATAAAAAVVTVLVWAVGPWGEPASLGEAALPPPYGADFFVERMLQWVGDMRPALNGPLLALGIAVLLAQGRRWAEDGLAAVALVWLLPLAGLFGFLAGIAYPYYRFFNTTLSWVLLVGIGAFAALRFFLSLARAGGRGWLAVLGVVGVIAILASNFTSGFEKAHWNDPDKGWMSAQTRADLDALRAALAGNERPVVFVIDDETAGFQIWGVTKLYGNTSRYGLPSGQVDQGHLYLGSLENFLAREPTTRGEATYDKLSAALLRDAEAGIARAGAAPIVVVASAFNTTGANADIASGDPPPEDAGSAAAVVVVRDGVVEGPGNAGVSPQGAAPSEAEPGSALHVVAVCLGLLALLVPGALSLRWFVRGAGVAEAVGMIPALALALLTLSGIVVLSGARAPFSVGLAWAALVGAGLVGLALAAAARRAGSAASA